MIREIPDQFGQVDKNASLNKPVIYVTQAANGLSIFKLIIAGDKKFNTVSSFKRLLLIITSV
jgi:hypothetical protein